MDTTVSNKSGIGLPENLASRARKSKHGRLIERAWHLYGSWGNKTAVAREIRKLAQENGEEPPNMLTIERWLLDGERYALKHGDNVVSGPSMALRKAEHGEILASVARDETARAGERIQAVRTDLERTGGLAPKRIEIRSTLELLGRQPVAVLQAQETELLAEIEALNDAPEAWQPPKLLQGNDLEDPENGDGSVE